MHMYKMNFCPLIETQKFNTSSLWNLVVRIFYVLWITINDIHVHMGYDLFHLFISFDEKV